MLCGVLVWAGIFALTGEVCVLYATVGIPCPGCGSTRAAVLLMQGHFSEAFSWHPLIILSMVLLPYIVIRSAFSRRKPFTSAEKRVLLGITALYLIVYAARMLLLFPHTPPMDFNEDILIRIILQ